MEEDQKVSWEFVRDHVLSRLTNLEEEVRLLRKVCWPVCQAFSEDHQLADIQNKTEFLKFLDEDEAHQLLKKKAKMYRMINKNAVFLLNEEISQLLNK